jgi:hypothetical protein
VAVREGSAEAEWFDRFGRVVGRRSVPLRDLAPTADHTWHPHEWRHKLAVALVGLAIPAGSLALWRLAVSGLTWLWFAAGVGLGMAAAVAYAVLDPCRVEYAWFRYRSGTLAFVICRSGPDQEIFDAFVAQLERTVRAAAAP